MDFYGFSTYSFFFRFNAYGLRLSGLGFDGFFLFFNLLLLFPFHCPWSKAVGFRLWWIFLFFAFQLLFLFYCLCFNVFAFRLWWIFFFFSTCSFFLHFIAYGLRLSGSGFDGFFLFFNLQHLFAFYCVWFKAVGLALWWIFFVLQLAACFSILLPFVYGCRG